MIRVLILCLALAVSACGAYNPKGTLSIQASPQTVPPYAISRIQVFENVDGGSTYEVTSQALITASASGAATFDAKTNTLTANGYGGSVTIKATWKGQATSAILTLTPATLVNAWGDTLTHGPGTVISSQSYPSQLQKVLQRHVVNDGVSGQTSSEIAARQGGAPAHLSFAGNDLAASSASAVSVDVPLLFNTPAGTTLTGSVDGFHGTLSRVAGAAKDGSQDAYSFQQDAGGLEQTVPAGTAFIPDTAASYGQVNLIWAGRNNYSQAAQVESDIAAMVGALKNSDYLVLSVLNGEGEGKGTAAYAAIAQLNADLARSYGAKFVDVRAALVAAYDPTKPGDVQDQANDIPPASLRADSVNLLGTGYAVVEKAVASAMDVQGY